MRYAVRNTVILGILWLLVIVAGVLYERRRAETLLRLRQREKQVTAKLEEVSGYVAIYEDVRQTLRQLQGRWQSRPRVLMAQDDPGRTFAYLNDILDLPEAFVTFDFTYVGRVDSTSFSQNTYTLSGDGDFRSLAHFIWFIEHGQPFYALSNLDVRGNPGFKMPVIDSNEPVVPGAKAPALVYDPDRVQFNMTFRVYFSPNSHVQDTLFVLDQDPPPLDTNPFRPLIHDELPVNTKGLFEVAGAQLRGVGYRKAFLVDKGGKLHVLREGDPVFMGALSRVDQARNRVEFLLNRGGIADKVVLEVQLQGEKEP
ncbi:MAG: hypothetical protein EXS64_10780 [Candidatus Latescibacteria bacterium]|nr:hypothetical protein [Candidatus Latescibacterota bacterium]